MMKKIIPVFFVLLSLTSESQILQDSVITLGNKIITLSEVVIDNRLNVPSFINRVRDDSSFYKAFRNLRILGFTALNDIRMLDKKGGLDAALFSRTKQVRRDSCRTMQVLDEKIIGDIYNEAQQYNYYTLQMYASLFFTKGKICGENNTVAGINFSTEGKRGMEKHKEQLKMLFFNPGQKISGLPFMSGKTAIFDDDIAGRYDMDIDMDYYNNTNCYIFHQKVKPGMEDKVVVDEMTTWFNDSTFEVVARNYNLSYDAGVYDFKVNMEVKMTRYNGLTVPTVIRYNGNWKAITKKRERGIFTATLFDFE